MNPKNYRVRLEYMPPIQPSWSLWNDPEWKITGTVSYWKADQSTDDGVMPSSSYQLFWPVNPWHELDLIEKKVA
ncbi:hypothetical protein UFOVP247_65 [uncultured Caudovirales phage]|uniref:Uncharacterized protein n=1 Tax=uncultured Caudovirales phage TaxID=2100421 RepID=A0A6J7WVZ1_9CAUD|nr:hypothetical protein UFOVP247_65 [uncultured Caudovirales phage]